MPYRFDKSFQGVWRENGIETKRSSTLSVRYLLEGTEAAFEPFSALAESRGLFKTTAIGRGNVGLITARQTYDLIRETLLNRPWLLTKADAMAVKPDLALAAK